jgi:hypothetical protein
VGGVKILKVIGGKTVQATTARNQYNSNDFILREDRLFL